MNITSINLIESRKINDKIKNKLSTINVKPSINEINCVIKNKFIILELFNQS